MERERRSLIKVGEHGCVSTTKRKTPPLAHLSTEATRWSKRMSMHKSNVRRKKYIKNNKEE